jgi:hypothetical protein
MSSLSPQPQNETVAILRHPSWHEPNPFTVIPLPAHDLSQYNTDEIIGFALACRKVFEKLHRHEWNITQSLYACRSSTQVFAPSSVNRIVGELKLKYIKCQFIKLQIVRNLENFLCK